MVNGEYIRGQSPSFEWREWLGIAMEMVEDEW